MTEQEKITEFLRKKAHHLLNTRFNPEMHKWMDDILDQLLAIQAQKEREQIIDKALKVVKSRYLSSNAVPEYNLGVQDCIASIEDLTKQSETQNTVVKGVIGPRQSSGISPLKCQTKATQPRRIAECGSYQSRVKTLFDMGY